MDNKRKKRHDAKLISLREQYEVRYWTRALGVTAERLRAAVKAVGHSVAKVRAHMRADAWAKP
jgi:hypothetical protein